MEVKSMDEITKKAAEAYEKGFKEGKLEANKELNEKIKKVNTGLNNFLKDMDPDYKKEGGLRKG